MLNRVYWWSCRNWWIWLAAGTTSLIALIVLIATNTG